MAETTDLKSVQCGFDSHHSYLFDKIDHILRNSDNEIFNSKIETYPSIFYLGLGKTGSASLCNGFPNNKVAHWHSEKYFETIYNLKLDNISLLDIVNNIRNKINKDILIIEKFREPVSRHLSFLFQLFHTNLIDKKLCTNLDFIKDWMIKNLYSQTVEKKIYSINWKKYNIDILQEFDPNKDFYYKDCKDLKMKFLYIKYELSISLEDLFSDIGYIFHDKKYNETSARNKFFHAYSEAKKIKFAQKDLVNWYDNSIVKSLYTTNQIESFIKRFSENE